MGYSPTRIDGITEKYARGRFHFAERLNQQNNKKQVDLIMANQDPEEQERLEKIGRLLRMDRDYWSQFILKHYGTALVREVNSEKVIERPLA